MFQIKILVELRKTDKPTLATTILTAKNIFLIFTLKTCFLQKLRYIIWYIFVLFFSCLFKLEYQCQFLQQRDRSRLHSCWFDFRIVCIMCIIEAYHSVFHQNFCIVLLCCLRVIHWYTLCNFVISYLQNIRENQIGNFSSFGSNSGKIWEFESKFFSSFLLIVCSISTSICLFKMNSGNTNTMCEIIFVNR